MDRWETIEHAYHSARDLSGEDRSRFLDEQCRSDVAMRQQIEALLAQDETPDSFLNRPFVELLSGLRSAAGRRTLSMGRSVGLYEVIEHIGSGGMGEVYRARDTKLNRDVALKVLPAAFALDPHRLARFKREAQVLASLNHPNIGAIYGFEESDGVQALVLELVAGSTLYDRIARGPIPIDEALSIARQLAKALEAAHDHGIIHRDLKPANIKIQPDGTAKVLDFGLAKALEPPAATDATSPSDSPPMTEAGVVLGTPAYMSPEQAKGHSADKRSDVWAFGCMLYEMLTGKRAFPGEDLSDTLAAVLRGEPDWNALPAAVPGSIRALIKGCLEKDRKERIADLSTASFLLNERRDWDATVGGESMAAQKAMVRRSIVVGGGLLVAAVIGVAGWYFQPSQASPFSAVTRFTIAPAATLATPSPYRDIDISPDGAHIAYNTGTNPAIGDIWVRALDQLDAVRLQGLEVPKSPFFSADGQWIGFFSALELRKVPVKGGSAKSIGPARGIPQGASWNSRNTIVFATSDLSTGLLTVSADGGEPAVLTKPNPAEGEVDHLFPSFLPGGDAVLFTVTKNGVDHGEVAVLDLKTGKHTTLIRNGSGARYIDTGQLVYASAGALQVVRFDPVALNVLSDPVTVVEHVLIKPSGAPDFSVSAGGTLVYVAGDVEPPQRSLVWVDRQGHEERIAGAPIRAYVYPRISPEGTRVALDIRDQDNDIWVWDLARETLSRVTADPAADVAPVWTPDGRDIIFGSTRAGIQDLYRQQADGSRPAERLTVSDSDQFPLSISPDGKQLVVRKTNNPAFVFDLFLLHLNGPGGEATQPAAPLMPATFPKDNGIISPNGRWLAYESNESTQYQIYVRPFPDFERERWQVSNAGGRSPVWAPDGRELFYLDLDGFLTRVPVETSRTFDRGKPARVLSTSYYRVNIRTYDVSLDGQKFLMIKDAAQQQTLSSREIVVVEHWFEELKRRAPNK